MSGVLVPGVILAAGGSPAAGTTTLAIAVNALVVIAAAVIGYRATRRDANARAVEAAEATRSARDAAREATEAARKSAAQLDVWRRREETMRLLRWGAEQAVEPDATGRVGIAMLRALVRSEPALLQPEDKELVLAVVSAVTAETQRLVGRETDSTVDWEPGGRGPSQAEEA